MNGDGESDAVGPPTNHGDTLCRGFENRGQQSNSKRRDGENAEIESIGDLSFSEYCWNLAHLCEA